MTSPTRPSCLREVSSNNSLLSSTTTPNTTPRRLTGRAKTTSELKTKLKMLRELRGSAVTPVRGTDPHVATVTVVGTGLESVVIDQKLNQVPRRCHVYQFS